MKFIVGLLLGAALASSPTQAQIMVAQPQANQNTQPTVAPAPQLQAVEIDKDAVIRRLHDDNARLKAENASLQDENASLSARIAAMTSLGGSEVHAYCPNSTTSRNTAGAESSCADLGGYTCESVSGLCRTRCQTTDMCAPGWTCDTGIEQCVNTSGG